MRINKSYIHGSSSHIVFVVLFTFVSLRHCFLTRTFPVFLAPPLPGVPVLLRVLLGADLQGVQHGPPHGPHLCLPAGRRAGLPGHHHPAAGGGAAGKTGCAGETRVTMRRGLFPGPLPAKGKLQR